MKTPRTRPAGLPLALLAALLCAGSFPASADEAAIRKNLADHMPSLPKIDEVSKTAIPGIYELRMGTDLLYTDENGNFLIEGSVFDIRNKVDLTKARIDKLTAIDFAALPLKDAMVGKQGNGSRKLVIFADPNCGYCKRIERDLLAVKDVTVYTFLIPILGADSVTKSRDIWCAKDSQATWRSWMIDGATPPKMMAKCDTAALDRNLELSRKYKITGTPAVVFEDGTRVPGAIATDKIEKQLVASAAANKKN
ncbi:MAG TPA: DsbC family protein [Ideonella sp.]|nr:DsbC family protein [Ideonella sp.]